MILKSFTGVFAVIFWCNSVFGFSGGPPAERTGNSGEICGDDTCASTCHTSFPVDSGGARFSVSVSSAFYKPGQALEVTISFNSVSTASHGFEITAVDASGNKAGTFANKDTMTQTEPYDNLYAAHTRIGTAENQWTVQWTAPVAKVSSPVTFYAAGNEANGDSTSSGDYIYTSTATISQSVECIPSQMRVKPGRVFVQRGKSAVVSITVKGENKEPCKNSTVVATVAKTKVSMETSQETDENGKTQFTVTAGDKKGRDVITFSVQDDGASLTKKIKVRIK